MVDGQLDKPWRTTLATIPGVGIKRAKVIADYCGSLGKSLEYLSDTVNLTLDSKPKDIGIKTFTEAQRWLGLQPNEVIIVIPRDMLEPAESNDELPKQFVDGEGVPIELISASKSW